MWEKGVVVMALSSLFSFIFPVSMAIDPSCDYYQEVMLGQEYYIYNREYPAYYPPSTSCRWLAQSPVGTVIVLACEDVDLPNTQNCQSDRLAVSLTGDSNFNDAHNYCGKGSISLVTETNALAVALIAPAVTLGGRFVCSLTAIRSDPPPTTQQPVTCDCGWKQTTRIVGGNETGINEYPSMAALIDIEIRDLYCGASIISDRYALTAAHCLNNKVPSAVGLLVGDHNITSGTDTPYAALYILIEFKVNPNYDEATQQNDIAVVKTQLPITISYYVGPVCLPFKFTTDDFYQQTVTALGWGTMEFSGPKSDTLQGVNLSVISNVDCATNIPDPISNNQICTYATLKDTCLSDSGGPLLWKDATSKRLHLVGVISYGVGCATTRPAVNTRVTSYLSWIVSVTSDAKYCIR